MTKRSTRVASFIMAIIMLLVSVLFTEFGTIKVSAGSTDAGTTVSGNAQTTTTGAAARQDYLIRVFPIPNRLTDYNSMGASFYSGVLQRVTTSGWQAVIGSTNSAGTVTDSKATLGKYRTLGYSAWIHPRNCSIATVYSDYEDGNFKGYKAENITSKSLITTSEIGKDTFSALFSGLDENSLGDTWYGGESEISDIIENNVRAYKSAHSKDETGVLASFKKHIANATEFQELIETGKVTLGFEIYVGMSKDAGATTNAYFSVSALQDYAKAKSNALSKKTGTKASGAFSASDKFKNAHVDDFSFALYWSFPLAYNSLLPAYYTSSTWYKSNGQGQRVKDTTTGYCYGGGGWCFYSFKVPTGTTVVPKKTSLSIPLRKVVKLANGSDAPKEAQVNVTFGYSVPILMTKTKASTTAAQMASYYATGAKDVAKNNNLSQTSYSYAINVPSTHTEQPYSAGLRNMFQNVSSPGGVGEVDFITTKSQQAILNFPELTLITNSQDKAETTSYAILIWEKEVVNSTATVGSWSARPIGVLKATCTVSGSKYSWSYSFASITGNNSLYTQPSADNRAKLGTLSWGSSRVTATNYYTISRQSVVAEYPLFNLTAEDKAVLTYDATAWKGSALISNNTDAKRTMYTRKVNLTTAEENSLGGLPSIYRLLSGASYSAHKEFSLSYFAKKLWTADFNHSAPDTLARASTLTVNAPKVGTKYSNSKVSTVSFAVSGKTDADGNAAFTFSGIAAVNIDAVLFKGAHTTSTFSIPYVTTASWTTAGEKVTLKKGTTYTFDTKARNISNETNAKSVLSSIGKYAQRYAAYEALANRNYLELSKLRDYYMKQTLYLESTLREKGRYMSKATVTDTQKYKEAKELYNKCVSALKTLTGYNITAPKGSLVVNRISGKTYEAVTGSYYGATYGQALSSATHLAMPSTDSLLGTFFAKWSAFATELHSIENNRPNMKITVSTVYNATDKNTDVKQAVVPEYYLSMKWTSPKHFLTSGDKLRTMVYDYNANTVLERFTISTTPEMLVTNKAGTSTPKNFTFRRLVYNSPSTFYTAYSKLTDNSAKISKIGELDDLFHKDITIDDKSTNGSRFDLVLGNNYAPTASASRALDAHIDTADYFKTYSSIWQIQNNSTDATKTYLPTNAWAQAWGIEAPVNTGIVPATAYKNKGAVSKITSVSGSNMIRIYAANVYAESNKSAYKRFASKSLLAAKIADGATYKVIDALRINTLPSGYSGTSSIPVASGVEKDATWSRQSTVYKLSAKFSKRQAGTIAPKTITSGVNASTNSFAGWLERTGTKISVNPLVKIAYYKKLSGDNSVHYTYVAGTEMRKVPATTYYTVSIKSASNGTPVATALALASDSRALTLSKRLTGNTKTPVAYSGTGVQVSASGSTTLEFKAYSLINADSGKDYQKDWGNTAESGNILSKLLADNKLGFKTETITQNGKTYSGIAYSSAYTAKLGEKTWDMKSNTGGYALSTGNSTSVTMPIKVAGGQVVSITIPKEYTGASKATTIRVSDSDLNKAITNGTLPSTTFILNTAKHVKAELYDALIKMGITGKTDTDILYNAFAHNEGAEVTSDVNGKKADGLLLGGGKNWYNEYCNCLAIRVETVSYSLNNKPVIDKIPIEAGPAQPADKSKYFKNGYGFSITALKIKIGNKTLTFNYSGAQPQFIVSDVPVTAAH